MAGYGGDDDADDDGLKFKLFNCDTFMSCEKGALFWFYCVMFHAFDWTDDRNRSDEEVAERPSERATTHHRRVRTSISDFVRAGFFLSFAVSLEPT